MKLERKNSDNSSDARERKLIYTSDAPCIMAKEFVLPGPEML